MASRSAYAMGAPRVNLRAAQILSGIDVEKPPGRRQPMRMSDLAALNQRLNRQHIHLFAAPGRGRLESRKTASASGFQFPFQNRQRCPAKHRGKGLRKSVDGRHSHRALGDMGMPQKAGQQRGRQKWQIDGNKNGPARGSRSQGADDPAQGPEAGPAIFDERSECLQHPRPSCDRNRQSSVPQKADGTRHKRLPVQLNQSLVRAHAARLASGEDKSDGLAPPPGGCGFRLPFHRDQMALRHRQQPQRRPSTPRRVNLPPASLPARCGAVSLPVSALCRPHADAGPG